MRRPDQAVDRGGEELEVNRFQQEAQALFFDHLLSEYMAGVATDEEDTGVRIVLMDDVIDLLAVSMRHDDIKDDEIDVGLMVKENADSRLAIIGQEDPVPQMFKVNLQGLADQFIVIGQEVSPPQP